VAYAVSLWHMAAQALSQVWAWLPA
jgi:hypothetical protein